MIKILLLVILLCAIAIPCHAWPARVVAVTDGDTITVEPIEGGERVKIRLHGIDAPERKQSSGEAARTLLVSVALYQPVVIEEKSRDRYGRSVAIVWLATGESLQVALLDAGLAWVWPLYCRNCHEWEQRCRRRLGNPVWGFGRKVRRFRLGNGGAEQGKGDSSYYAVCYEAVGTLLQMMRGVALGRMNITCFWPGDIGRYGGFYPCRKPGDVKFSFKPTFPNNDDMPPRCKKCLLDTRIPLHILFKFIFPLLLMCFWGCCILAAKVSVPKTTMNENCDFVFWQYYIWCCTQYFGPKAVPESPGMEESSYNDFWLGIRGPYSCHHSGSCCGWDDIHV